MMMCMKWGFFGLSIFARVMALYTYNFLQIFSCDINSSYISRQIWTKLGTQQDDDG
jgi:hypothetical protein